MNRPLKKIALTAMAVLAMSASRSRSPLPAASSAWVVLDHGRQGDYLWSVKASRSGGPARRGPRATPRAMPAGRDEMDARDASATAEPLPAVRRHPRNIAATEAPLVASGVVPEQRAEDAADRGGMIFSSKVRRVQITYSAAPDDDRGEPVQLRPIAGQ